MHLGKIETAKKGIKMNNIDEIRDLDIAIVGMAGRFPKADSVEELWDNLLNGRDCITRSSYVSEKEFGYEKVNAFGKINDIYAFDNELFDIGPIEAKNIDPQERLLLQTVYEALEDASCNPEKFEGTIGIVCGGETNEYYLKSNEGNKNRFLQETEKINAGTSLTSRISYKLNLTGPSVIVSTACATSLSAIHIASRMLLNYEADMMLAGGVNIFLNQEDYVFIEGVTAKDGVVRAFDKNGTGFVPGNAVGIVALKRLEDAVKDNDNIYAVIKGSAITNDGNRKIGFAAPSVSGEYDAVKAALDASEVSEDEIDFIETHGTATPLGDSVEVRALKKIFEKNTEGKSIALGSLKSNCGHLNMAAGVTGVIKSALILKNGIIPPVINVNEENEEIEHSPFYLNKEKKELSKDGRLRRGGVSAFGIGGANAHIVLEEYREKSDKHKSQKKQLLLLSAKSSKSLNGINKKYEEFIKEDKADFESAAYSLQKGRIRHEFRNFIIAQNEKGISFVSKINELSNMKKRKKREVVFMFPGTGSDYENMAVDLYENNNLFKKYYDQCNNIVKKELGNDADILNGDSKKLHTVKIFSVSYSMAETLIEMGIKPDKVMGHSLGEYAAAAVAESIKLEDALKLIIKRTELIETIPAGNMISVAENIDKVKEMIFDGISIAGVNTPERIVLSCDEKYLEKLKETLDNHKAKYKVLPISRAGHSEMMRIIEKQYRNELEKVEFKEGIYDIVSTYEGKKVEKNHFSNPDYWINQMVGTVNFSKAIESILENDDKDKIFLETGPGKQLTTFAKKHFRQRKSNLSAITTIENNNEYEGYLKALGEMWKTGIEAEWNLLYEKDHIKKVSLPKYVFEENHYNILENKKSSEIKYEDLNSDELIKVYRYGLKDKKIIRKNEKNSAKRLVILSDEKNSKVKELYEKLKEYNINSEILENIEIDKITENNNVVSIVSLNDISQIISFTEENCEKGNIDEIYFISGYNEKIGKDISGAYSYVNENLENVKTYLLDFNETKENILELAIDEIRFNKEDNFVVYINGRRFIRYEESASYNEENEELTAKFIGLNNVMDDKFYDYYSKIDTVCSDNIDRYADEKLILNENDLNILKDIEKEQDEKEKVCVEDDISGLNETYRRVCLSASGQYFADKGFVKGKEYDFKDIIQELKVIDNYKPFVRFLLKILEKNGYAQLNDEKVIFTKELKEIESLEKSVNESCIHHKEFKPFIELLKTCAMHYDEVFTGQIPGNSIIYPNGNFDMLNKIDSEIPNTSRMVTCINALPKIMDYITSKSEMPIKILEIGSGTGRISWPLIDILKNRNVEYYFTDIGKSFLSIAKERCRKNNINNVKFKMFNIENEYYKEGFRKNEFDIIIGLDVIQATTGIEKVVKNLYSILKENGLMLMLQTFKGSDIIDMIYGYAPGWWNYEKDELRKGRKMVLDSQEWKEVYRNAGFKNVASIHGGYNGQRNDVGIIMGNKIENMVSKNTESIDLGNLYKFINNEFSKLIISLDIEKELKQKNIQQILEEVEKLRNSVLENDIRKVSVIIQKLDTIDYYIIRERLISDFEAYSETDGCLWNLLICNHEDYEHVLYADMNLNADTPSIICHRIEKSKKEYEKPEESELGKNLSEVEKDLLSIIKTTIDIEEISIEDNVFDLGVDSLSILIINTKIREKFNCEISIKELYDCENIKNIADFIKAKSKDHKEEGLTSKNTEKKQIKSLDNLFASLENLE